MARIIKVCGYVQDVLTTILANRWVLGGLVLMYLTLTVGVLGGGVSRLLLMGGDMGYSSLVNWWAGICSVQLVLAWAVAWGALNLLAEPCSA